MSEVQISFIDDKEFQSSIESHVDRKDFKGLLAYLKSLTKQDLQTSLLMSGFSISGRFNQWIDGNEQALIKSCQLGLTPRQQIEFTINALDETKPYKTLTFKADTNMKPKLNKPAYFIYKHKDLFVVSFLDEITNIPKATIHKSDDVYRNFRESTWVLI